MLFGATSRKNISYRTTLMDISATIFSRLLVVFLPVWLICAAFRIFFELVNSFLPSYWPSVVVVPKEAAREPDAFELLPEAAREAVKVFPFTWEPSNFSASSLKAEAPTWALDLVDMAEM